MTKTVQNLVVALAGLLIINLLQAQSTQPSIDSIRVAGADLIISATIPSGYGNAVLMSGDTVITPPDHTLVAGPLDGSASLVTFTIPDPRQITYFLVKADQEQLPPPADYSGPAHFFTEAVPPGGGEMSDSEKVHHVLNRVAYGPSVNDVTLVEAMGVEAYIQEQLNPQAINEQNNTRLHAYESDLFHEYQPADNTSLIEAGDVWAYFKGTQEPPLTWNDPAFEDSTWLTGPTGIGYGDNNDETELDDMRMMDDQPGYLSFYLRRKFSIAGPESVDQLILRVIYDDGFVAYLNGVEVARANVVGTPPRYNQVATVARSTATGELEFSEFDITDFKAFLNSGENLLAIQLHNVSLTSSDASMIPELVSRIPRPVPPITRIDNIDDLQRLIHIRGAFAKRQLQSVLAEFWENHFTTDYDKVADYFYELENSDGKMAMSESQARAEAAQVEYEEYQFFYDNALGNFSDLLLYSATSPSQLIYLDNVLNRVGEPNENYAREILELFAFGVDNRYTQFDIEELSRCFTGWQIRKMKFEDRLEFPASAIVPPTDPSVIHLDQVLLDDGQGWKYFKGTTEPSRIDGRRTTAWTEPEFDDSTWLIGATSIGYGLDEDHATVLSDMRNSYMSVYLRRNFTLVDPQNLENLFLAADFDDSFVAYINGTEVARTDNLQGYPPSFLQQADSNHEVTDGTEYFSLNRFINLLNPAPQLNVLAIQGHNINLSSSDFSIRARLIERTKLPGSIENGDPNGVWTFRFNPDDHDFGAKVLFPGTPHEMIVPEDRSGIEGLRDATDIIQSMVDHPSTSEFICLKLINKFVSDQISLQSYKDGTAPEGLRHLLDEAIAAWHDTQPAGNIKTVINAILDTEKTGNYFWSKAAYRSKIRTPVEFINATIRALDVELDPEDLPDDIANMGMFLFRRDEPNGWSELGLDWIGTGGLLERINFVRRITQIGSSGVGPLGTWDVDAFLSLGGMTTAEEIVDYCDNLLFRKEMNQSDKDLLIQYANSSNSGLLQPLDPRRRNYTIKIRSLMPLILSMPQWQYQ